jgi:two-component system, OmpR family, alkaline phosphatase synthesis response regulator PhoP
MNRVCKLVRSAITLYVQAMTRILIIEDEKPLRDAFAFLLKGEGYAVELAENGKVALEKLKTWHPDLLLLDVLMPVMSGIEFLKRAKLPKRYPTVKALMLSSLSDPVDREEAVAYGVSDVILKADLSPNDLVATVKQTIGTRQSKGAAA